MRFFFEWRLGAFLDNLTVDAADDLNLWIARA